MTVETMPAATLTIPSADAIEASIAADSLEDYVQQAWPVLEPKTTYLSNWHIGLLCEYLTAVLLGQVTRLIINEPPRYMKSLLVSVMWPTWAWIKAPHLRWLFASYSLNLSIKHSVDRRDVLRSPWYRARWGDRFRLAEDANLKSEFQNTAKGAMVALSVGGGTGLGKGADVLVVDDPVNPKQAHSDVLREAANRYFDQTLMTRLNDKERGAVVVVMQRLHERDLTGHLLADGGWTHLCLPAEAERHTMIHFPLSGETRVREAGEVLWPDREGLPQLAELKTRLGTTGYAGQYQQRPSPEGGAIIKEGWLCWYLERPVRFDLLFASWDLAFKKTSDSSYVAGQVWGVLGARRYLLDRVRRRMSFTETVRAIKALHAQWPAAVPILVEDKANGPAVISTLEEEVPGIIPVEPDGDKVARCHACAPYFEAGNVILPVPAIAPWVQEYVAELLLFPNAASNDETDATTQALNYAKQFGSVSVDMMKHALIVPSEAAGLFEVRHPLHGNGQVNGHGDGEDDGAVFFGGAASRLRW